MAWLKSQEAAVTTAADLTKTVEMHADIQTIKVEVNDRLTQLLKVTGASERAQGVLEGMAAGQST